ncbi:hypothetical protein ACJJTC_013637 [Scirpophaga incertulas]
MKFACCKSTSEGAVGALICTTCNKNFHVACLYPTDKKKALSTEFKKAWICPDCTVNQPRLAKNDNTPVRVSQCTSRPVLSDNDNVNCRRGGSCSDSPPPSKQVDKKDNLVATPSIGEIVKSCIVTEMEVMRSELRAAISEAIARELKPIREEMVSIKESLNFISNQHDVLKKRVDDLEKDFKMQRHVVCTLSATIQTLLGTWMLYVDVQQLPSEVVICQECFLLLNDHCRRGNMEAVRQLGHTHVCLGCGRSVLDDRRPIRHHTIEANDPLISILCSWNTFTEVITRSSFVCHSCWMRATRQISRDQNRNINTEHELENSEQPTAPVAPTPPLAYQEQNNSEMMLAVIKESKESSQSDSVDELRDSECSDLDLSASTVKSNDNDSTYIEEEPNTNSSSSDESFDSVPAKELKNLQIIKPDKEKRERKKPARGD